MTSTLDFQIGVWRGHLVVWQGQPVADAPEESGAHGWSFPRGGYAVYYHGSWRYPWGHLATITDSELFWSLKRSFDGHEKYD